MENARRPFGIRYIQETKCLRHDQAGGGVHEVSWTVVDASGNK